MLLPEAVLLYMFHDITWGCASLPGLYSPCPCLWFMLLPEVMFGSMLCGAEEYTWMSMVSDADRSHDEVSVLWYNQGPCCEPCSTLPLEAICISMVHVAAEDDVGVHDPCYYQKLWQCIIHNAAGNHMEVHIQCGCWLWRNRKLLIQWYWWLQTHNEEQEAFKASVNLLLLN